jgi:hypothetical protein
MFHGHYYRPGAAEGSREVLCDYAASAGSEDYSDCSLIRPINRAEDNAILFPDIRNPASFPVWVPNELFF